MEDWVKLSVRYYTDEKIEGLPDADAEVMFVRGLARAGEVGRGGFVPAESLPKLARRRRYAAPVRALLAAGLWTKVDGGYQITAWDHWQDGLDALARRRKAERERQRRRRAAAREATRGSRDGSRDRPADVTLPEGEEEGDSRGYSSEGEFRAEPPRRCPRHETTPTPPPCGACADARRDHDQWETERAKRITAAPKCPVHEGQLARNCAPCRSERLAKS